MAERVQQRCEMMIVLLVAGEWLDREVNKKALDKYKMGLNNIFTSQQNLLNQSRCQSGLHAI
jgi:hypothetical protein